VHQNRCRLELRLRPHWVTGGAYSTPPDPCWFQGGRFVGRAGEGRTRGGEEGKGGEGGMGKGGEKEVGEYSALVVGG